MGRIEASKVRSKLSQASLIFGLLALGLSMMASKTHAQEPEKRTGPLQILRDCMELIEDELRLACYDNAVTNVIAQQDSGEIRLLDEEDIAETRRGLFGFSLPKLGIFGSGDDKDATVLQSEITSVRRVDRDKWLIKITEGSVWQVSNAPRRFKPEVGDPVELEKAAMSSYWVRVDGALGVKGRRVE